MARFPLSAFAAAMIAANGDAPPQPLLRIPFADLGAGQVSLALTAGAGALTHIRATPATCWGSNGRLLTVGPGIPRSNYTELTGASYLGFLKEEARTNNVLWCRDFTNGAWTKTAITPALDQAGIDGVGNTASSLLATAPNATASQAVVLAAVNRAFSIYAAQLAGVGGFDLSQDGVSFTHYALTGAYQRFVLVASQLNPTLTVRVPVSGDKIAVDYTMLEDNTGAPAINPGTPILTTVAAVTRNADGLSLPSAGNINTVVGTCYAKVTAPPAISGYVVYANTSVPLYIDNGTQVRCYDATTVSAGAAFAPSLTVPKKIASRWSGALITTFAQGVAGVSTVFDGNMNTGVNLFFGSNGDINVFLNGCMQDVTIWGTALSDVQIAAL